MKKSNKIEFYNPKVLQHDRRSKKKMFGTCVGYVWGMYLSMYVGGGVRAPATYIDRLAWTRQYTLTQAMLVRWNGELVERLVRTGKFGQRIS